VDQSQLKIVNISGKGLKKELLITSKEVYTMSSFLKGVIENEIMIISTNLGLQIYYYSKNNQVSIIVNTFLLLAIGKGKTASDFFIKSLDSDDEIARETRVFFEKLFKNPLLFRSYSKSLCNQLSLNYDTNPKIISELMSLWENELLNMSSNKILMDILTPSIMKLRGSHFEEVYQPILQKLVKESLSLSRVN